MIYGDINDSMWFWVAKNKANSKPNKLVPSTPFRAGSERSRMDPKLRFM